MEKVWEELKKIDSQAEQIRIEAQNDAKEINRLAQKEAEKLLLKSKNFAQQESETIYATAISKANSEREQQLRLTRETEESLTKQAQKRMDKAAARIVTTVLGEI